MKFGCCVGHTDREKIALLAKLGYDYIECNFSSLSDASMEQIEDFAAFTRDAGIPCEAANVFFKGDIRLTGPNVNYSTIEAYLAPAMEKARRAGIRRVVFGSGGARRVPEGFPMDEAYGQLIDISKRIIGPIAAANGITVAVEELNQGETNIVNTIADGMRIVNGASHPNIALLLDLYHIAVENDPLEGILALGEAVQHVHIANPLNKRLMPRSGDTDEAKALYADFFSKLKTIGYDQRISIEAGVESDFAVEAKDALEILKRIWSA